MPAYSPVRIYSPAARRYSWRRVCSRRGISGLPTDLVCRFTFERGLQLLHASPHSRGSAPVSVHGNIRSSAKTFPATKRFSCCSAPSPPKRESGSERPNVQRPLPRADPWQPFDDHRFPHRQGRPLLHPLRPDAVPKSNSTRGGSATNLPG